MPKSVIKKAATKRSFTKSYEKVGKSPPFDNCISRTTLYSNTVLSSSKMKSNRAQHFKKMVLVPLWKFSVNVCDILGLLDIFPCGTIHSVKPYIHYTVQVN